MMENWTISMSFVYFFIFGTKWKNEKNGVNKYHFFHFSVFLFFWEKRKNRKMS